MKQDDRRPQVENLPKFLAIGHRDERWYGPFLFAVGIVIVASNLFVAFRHLADRYNISHVHGTWLALSWYVSEGTLYPPLFADGYYGGTRFGPLSILWNALFASLTGGLVTGTKLAAMVAVAATLLLAYVTIRRIGAPRPVAFALTASVLVTEPGFVAFCSPFRGDPAPVALQLFALLLIAQPVRTTKLVVAAALACATAVLFKMTAGVAVIAIGLLLLANDRRQLAVFCVTWFAIVGLGGLFFHAVTGGQMTANLFGLSASNLGGIRTFLGTPGTMNYILIESARVAWGAVPLILIGVVRSLNARRLSVYQLAWMASGAILLFVLADSGVSYNHFLVFVVMSVVALGELWVSFEPDRPAALRADRAMVVAVVLWMVAGDYDRVVADQVRLSMRTPGPELALDPLADLIPEGATLLSEDPSLPVIRGQRPVVLDAWMVTKMAVKNPERVTDLAARVERAEFDRIVLLVDLRDPFAKGFWYRQHFGLPVIAAIESRYELIGERFGYHVWKPR